LARLVQELNRLPGIGPKSAQRLAYYIIRLPDDDAYALADAVASVKQNIVFCEECQNLTDASPCQVCSDPRRDQTIICVVEDPLDVLAMERTRTFRGLYHVLHGVISPINGIGPDQLKLKELFSRLERPEVVEWRWLWPPTPPWKARLQPCTSAATKAGRALRSPIWPGDCP